MSWDVNVRDTPEKFRATIVGEIEWTEPCYSFDTTIVLRDDRGRFYVASDSGCSCPSPFEGFDSLDACDGPLTAHEVHAALGRELAEHNWINDDEKSSAQCQIVDLMARVMADRQSDDPAQERS